MTTATEETFDGKDGLKIYLRSWKPDGAPRAVVVICHGVNSHGGQYLWTAGELVKRAMPSSPSDLRGRGKSEGERFYVDDIRLCRRPGRHGEDRQGAPSRPAGLPAGP